tara:strand:+ start:110 stop:1120 length:1011 start_codon:yes stop_codon:yes gene_type:complete
MSSALQIQTSPVIVENVGRSWTQENLDLYGFSKLTRAKVMGVETGYSGTTVYTLGKLDNFMKGLRKFQPGYSRGTDRVLAGGDVSLKVDFFETPWLDRSSRRPMENRFADLEGNIVPGLQGQACVEIDRLLVQFLQNTSVWGPLKTFTNGPVQGNNPAMNIIVEINNEWLELQQYNQFNRTCIMDETTALVLRQADEYRSGANTLLILPESQFIENFRSYHNLDEVIILKSARNLARPGQTANIKTTGRGLLWFGLTDKRKSYEISIGDSSIDNKPDGSLCFGYSQMPLPDNWLDEAELLEYFRSTTSFGFFNPRLQSDNVIMGFSYDPASILTSP